MVMDIGSNCHENTTVLCFTDLPSNGIILQIQFWDKGDVMQKHASKIKLLKMWELLQKETDSGHLLTTNTICERMDDLGIYVDRRTLAEDIKVLNESGYVIEWRWVGKQKGYYVDQVRWDVVDLKVLIDAVQAANFISEEKTKLLINKLADLGDEQAEYLLNTNMVLFNTRKHNNPEVQSTIQLIEEAISEKKQLSFLYFDLNEKRERVYRKNRKRYVVEPVALIYFEDFYYLLTWNSKHHNVTRYRIDRIADIQREEEPVSEMARERMRDKNLSKYTSQVFKMYGGEEKEVTLRFDDELIGAVMDKFGEDVSIKRIDSQTCTATVVIQESPVSRAWVTQFEGKMVVEK